MPWRTSYSNSLELTGITACNVEEKRKNPVVGNLDASKDKEGTVIGTIEEEYVMELVVWESAASER